LKGGCWTAPVPGKGDSKKTLDAWWLNSVRNAERLILILAG
jgi:translation initiation factor 4E